MEFEVFYDLKDLELIFNKYLNKCKIFVNLVGIKDENIRIRVYE